MNSGFDESPLGSYTPRRFAFPANPVCVDGFDSFSADRLSILLRFRPVPPLRRIWVHFGGEPNHDPAVSVKAPANAPPAAGQDGRIGGSPTKIGRASCRGRG